LVLDLFGGSGSTMIAADQLQRKAAIMELDPKYVDVIVKRYIKHKGNNENCFIVRNGKREELATIETFENSTL